jgi:hypothetical protein
MKEMGASGGGIRIIRNWKAPAPTRDK